MSKEIDFSKVTFKDLENSIASLPSNPKLEYTRKFHVNIILHNERLLKDIERAFENGKEIADAIRQYTKEKTKQVDLE